MSKLLEQLLAKRFAPVDGDGTDAGAAPVEEPEVVETEVSEGDDLDWLLNDGDEEEPEPEPEPKPEPKEEPEQKEESAVEKPEPKEEPEPKVEPKEEQKEEPEAKKPEEVEEKKEPTEEEREQQREQYLAEVEKAFALSEEDANLMVTEPEKILPRLAARMHDYTMQHVAAMQQQMVQQLPQLMQGFAQQQTAAQQQESAFLEANPFLKEMDRTELEEAVNELAPIVAKRAAGKTPEEKLKLLGQTIAQLKGISSTPAKEKPAGGSEKPKSKPFKPAAPASSGVETPKPAPANQAEAWIDALLQNQDD